MEQENFGIHPYNGPDNFGAEAGYIKLHLNEDQQLQMNGFLQQMPSLFAASELANAYTVQFPEGVNGSLIQYKTSGYGTTLVNENGKFAGHADLYSMNVQAAAMACFSAMSIATGQYFLKQINTEIKMMGSKLDDILGFLYGSQKAELMAEINFVRYANQNYGSIMEHEYQRSAILASLLDARKIAIKNIEFYLYDLDNTIRKRSGHDIETTINKAFRIKESLMLAMQLYGLSSLLEVYYSQNFSSSYLQYVENDISVYIDKCEKRMLGRFSLLRGVVETTKGTPLKKTDNTAVLNQINAFLDTLSSGEESDIQKSLRKALSASRQKTEYYLTKDGSVYMKIA